MGCFLFLFGTCTKVYLIVAFQRVENLQHINDIIEYQANQQALLIKYIL